MTGYLKIKTKLDNKDIDKGIVEIESKIKKLQSENTSLSAQENDLQKEIEKYDKLVSKAEEYKTELRKLEEQKKSFSEQYNGMIPADKISFRDTLMSQIDSLNLKYAQTASEIDKQVPKLEKVSSKLSKINSKQADNNSKIEQFKIKIEGLPDINQDLNTQKCRKRRWKCRLTNLETHFRFSAPFPSVQTACSVPRSASCSPHPAR